MSPLDRSLLFGAGIPLLAAIVTVASEKGAFARDRFPSALRRRTALVLLFGVFILTVLIPASSNPGEIDTRGLRFPDIFTSQLLLSAFLVSWWLLAGRPRFSEFLSLQSEDPLHEAGAGICLGLIGWGVTFLVGIIVAASAAALRMPGPESVPPLIVWMAKLSASKKLLVVLAAMTVEEFYFRAFLQTRFGPFSASVFFILAHSGYGEPFFFAGILGITVILTAAFQRTRSILAPMVAHGVFNAIQLFIVLPSALRVVNPQ